MDEVPFQLAVLIDGENISASIADELFREIGQLGEVRDRRVYARPQTPWAATLALHAIRLCPISHSGKNSADIALVIDAMDMIHAGGIDGLCIASTDSDFAALAVRARQSSIKVFGFGAAKQDSPFRQACTEYRLLEKSSATGQSVVPLKAEPPTKLPSVATTPNPPVPPIIASILAQLADAEGWVQLAAVGQHLRVAQPPLQYKGKLKKLLERSGRFEFKNGPGAMVRARIRRAAS